ncbi:MAG: 2-C-methyl-D-erythritol 2,4-cyclodiphosphate synthase, partial [Eubacteriales bacterium]|nr:2-C-methyl-D-erythritol 2,4-cyclodiphosphate synthase [Eubacteriales bacterium]
MMHDSAPVFAAILAAGSSCRMGRDKLSLSFGGKSPVELSIEAFSACPINIEGIIVATSAANTEAVKALCSRYEKVHVIAGGASRGESAHNCVREALRLSAGRKAVIAIHDAARCLVDSGTICRAVEAAFAHGSGIAAIPARDTLRRADGQSVERDGLLVMQTPQCFDLDSIAAAYDKSRADGYPDTDDCAVYMRCIGAPHYSEGSIMNQKLTYAADIPFFTAAKGDTMRIGCGEDTHILTENRKLILGGVDIPYEKGLLGHSDADVLLHAVTDALLGAAALG